MDEPKSNLWPLTEAQIKKLDEKAEALGDGLFFIVGQVKRFDPDDPETKFLPGPIEGE